MADYAQALARVLAAKINDATTRFARGTVVSATPDGFVTFTDAMGSARKGVWTNVQPLAGDYVTYVDTGGGFPIVLGSSGARSWTNVTFQNSWSDYAGGWQTCQYRKVGDIVEVRGLATLATSVANSTIFALPVGYRPPGSLIFASVGNNGSGGVYVARIDVGSAGNVDLTQFPPGVSGAWLSLSPVRFATV